MRIGAVRSLMGGSSFSMSVESTHPTPPPSPIKLKPQVQLTRQRSVSSTTQNPTSTTAVAPAALAAASQLYHPPSAIQYPDTSSTTITTSSKIPIFYRAPMYFDRVAVTDVDGDFTYEDVFRRSCKLAAEIRRILDPREGQCRICVVCPKGVSFVIAQWAVWMSGHIMVPVLSTHSPKATQYFVSNSNAEAVICTSDTADKMANLDSTCPVLNGVEILCLGSEYTKNPATDFDAESDPIMVDVLDESFYAAMNSAMVLYTASASGKSVRKLMYNHSNLNAQAEQVAQAWQLTNKTSVLHGVPINTSYGISSAILAPLSVGGRVVMIPSNDPVKAWAVMLGLGYGIDKAKYPRTSVDVVCASPAQYQSMMQRYEELFSDPKKKQYVRNTCLKRVRLMVSTMKPVPSEFMEPWRQATGHSILECYSMPEVSNLTV